MMKDFPLKPFLLELDPNGTTIWAHNANACLRFNLSLVPGQGSIAFQSEKTEKLCEQSIEKIMVELRGQIAPIPCAISGRVDTTKLLIVPSEIRIP
ncbi:MAG: hypothetical protein UY41_C0010G0005 [Candidatus Moranbacteria bacterium GW2011_GWE1_49_15]|nr:MAG: hypothetical protein UX75_C0031G0005 [Candidatus Moranbacteria bacterium GW2011_GWE2_47_10]KKW07016.1 MAG: hypothetical protein UY41_C0010G0005 [Candidatus Moranbacteria bacterium GW2011_GWE1_49_15]HBP01489.1 hypothetical protein [Candidatus Moranbacteria bacterium]